MTDQVASLTAKYDDQVSAGAKAAADALNKVGDAAEYSEQKVTRAAKSGEQLTRQYDEQARLAAKVDTITAKYARDLDSLEKSELSLAEKERLRANILAQQEAAIQKAAAAHERYLAGLRALNASASSNDNMNRAMATASAAQAAAMDVSTASAKRFNTILQQGGYQVSDFANQVATGTNVATAFGMQFGQLAGVFGPVGAALGAVVNVGGVVIGMLSKMGDASNKSAEDIHMFSDMLDVFKGRAIEAGASVDDLTSTYRGLSAELRGLSKLALSADMDALAKKLQKGLTSNWQSILSTALADTKAGDEAVNIPILDALRKLGQDKDIASFLGRLQDLNAKGAVKLIGDADVQELLKTGEALRVAEARMADLEGRATPAQKALLGYAEAAKEAAKAASELATAQARAGASLFIQEKDLDAKIKALKGGEDAMKAYGEEQVRAAARSKAYDAAVKSGMETLDATAEANRVASKAVEAYRLEQQRSDALKASNKAESQAERDAKAYAKVTGELDRNIAEQQRLAGVVGQGVEAQREANTQTKIAEEMAKAHAAAGSEEAKVIEKKVRELEKWKNTVADAKVLEASKTQLAYSQKELSLMGQAEPLRERALKSFQIQQQAAELAKTTTTENVAEWVKFQEQIADTQALVKFQKQVESVSDNIAGDVATAMYDGFTGKTESIVDWFRSLLKRLAVEAIKANIVLPITQQVVGSMPGLFGIQSPGGSAANQNGGGLLGGGTGQLVQVGQNVYSAASGTNTIGTMASNFATSPMGYSLGLSSNAVAPGTGIAAGYVDTIGATQITNGMSLTSSGQAVTSGLGAIGAAAPYGMLGGMGGAYIGNATGSKAIGGLSGAALGVGSMAAGTAAMGAMGMGAAASAAGVSGMAGATAALSAIPVYGWIAAAVLAAITAIAGTQKPTVGPTASADVTINAGGKSATYGNVQTDNEGDPATGKGLGNALSTIFSLAAMGGGTLTKDFGIGQTAAKGLYVGGSVPYKEFGKGENALGDALRYMLLDQGGLQGGGTNTIKALKATKATDWEEAAKDVGLGASIDAGNTALKSMIKTLGGVTDAAKKAADESLKPMIDDLLRAQKLGIGDAYKSLASDQLKEYLEQLRNPPDFTQIEQDMASLKGQFQAAREAYAQLDPAMVSYVDQIERETRARVAANLNRSLDSQINEASGRGYVNQISGFIDTLGLNARSLAAVGEPATRANNLFNASLAGVLRTLTTDQLNDVVRTFGGDIGTLATQLATANDNVQQATQFETLFGRIRQDNLNTEIASLNEQKTAANGLLSSWKSVVSSVGQARQNLLVGDLSTLDPRSKMDTALAAYRDALGRAQGGDVDAAGQVSGLAQTALQAARAYYASNEDYARIFNEVTGGLGGVESVAAKQVSLQSATVSRLDTQIGVQQDMLRALQVVPSDIAAIIAGINSGNSSDIWRWSGTQDSGTRSRLQSAVLDSFTNADIEAKFGGFSDIIAARAADPSFNLAQWFQAYGKAEVLAGTRSIPGFATGTDYAPGGLAWVGEKGPELMQLPTGSRIYPHAESMGIARSWGAANDRWGSNVVEYRRPSSNGSGGSSANLKRQNELLEEQNRLLTAILHTTAASGDGTHAGLAEVATNVKAVAKKASGGRPRE